MPRVARGLIDGHPYHVLSRGNAGRHVFLKDMDYAAFIELLGEARAKFDVQCLAYCLMPNHIHFVFAPGTGPELSRMMQWLLTTHVRRYHAHYGGHGHVWQGRFKSFLIAQDEHFVTVLKYVEANPLRAGLVTRAEHWPWSSLQERIGWGGVGLLDSPIVELPADWRAFVNDVIPSSELERLRFSVNRRAPYGPRTWQQRMARKLGLESSLRGRGRPRKQS